jgi:hypothetical protein
LKRNRSGASGGDIRVLTEKNALPDMTGSFFVFLGRDLCFGGKQKQ